MNFTNLIVSFFRNIWNFVDSFSILGLVGFIGSVVFRSLFPKKKVNLYLYVGASMVLGPLALLFALATLSYFFRGWVFLIILFVSIVIICFLVYRKFQKKFFSNLIYPKLKDRKTNWIISILLGLNIILLFLFTGHASVGGDVLQYWSIATSFTKGNYPTLMPYQPDFLTVYHTGTYLILGLLHVVTQLDIDKVHFFFAFYLLTSVLFITTGLALRKNYTVFSLIPAVLGIIVFGGPIILTHFKNFNLFNYPTFDMTIGSIGAGAISTETLVYLIQILFSIAVFFVFVYILIDRDKDHPFRDYFLLTVLTSLNLSINEVFFPIQVFLTVLFFIRDYYKKGLKNFFIKATIFVLFFISLFFIVQNSTRDSLYTPSGNVPRFSIINRKFQNLEQFTAPLHNDSRFQETIVSSDSHGNSWYLPDIRILIVLGLIASLITGEGICLILSLSALISVVCSILIVYSFSPWGNFRFYSQAYQFMAFAFGYTIVDLVKNKKLKLIGILAFLVFVPQIFSSYSKIFSTAFSKVNHNYSSQNPQNVDLGKISGLLNSKDRLLIISFLGNGNADLGVSLDALVRYGLTVPLGPSVKILNIAQGMGWYDSVLYLDPPSLNRLGINYVYVNKDANNFLPIAANEAISDKKYFEPVAKLTNGNLYKVEKSFKDLPSIGAPTLSNMSDKILPNKNVYIDTIFSDIRRIMFLDLAQKNENLYGHDYLSLFGVDYYMAVEIPFPRINENIDGIRNIDYAIMNPGIDPSTLIYGSYKKIAETKYAVLWQRSY